MTSPLHHKPFLLFLLARAAATIAYQMTGVAVGWQIYSLTHRAFDLGLVGLVQFIPSAALVLLVGHVADRYDRRRIVFLAQFVEAAALAGLCLGSHAQWAGREAILAFIFLIGIARAFEFTTLQTLVPSLVDQETLPKAVALNASVRQAAVIIGPMMGGFLYIAGPAVVYAVSGALFLLSAAAIAAIRIERPLSLLREPVSLHFVFAGVSYIRSRRVVLGAISLDLFAVLLGGATALLPIYARDILSAGPWGLGFLRSAPAVGAFAASVYLARQPLQRKVGKVMFAAVTWFGIATIVFALSTSLALSFAALVVLGWSDMLSVVIRSTLVQLETPDEMRGRVSAVNAIFIGTSNELGEFESGLTAAWFGAMPAALIGGIGTLLVVLLWRRFFPELAQRERLQAD
ncbi:MFS transporter [Oryzomonas sagensis]|uniref:MFS transporter n=1 Tax=Oryzomonas sagensis TaxID=2603857 RepID=A0ABQ6TKJ8_9BACT|nr:MFS transporter [Oryzomonas sagensis]KAB0668606.1 MFS transporter [Oryzomonas sagensis]